jgi:hypothetical protein
MVLGKSISEDILGVMRKHIIGVCKIETIYNFVINVEQSGPDLGLATGDLDIETFDLECHLSLFPPPPPYFSYRL